MPTVSFPFKEEKSPIFGTIHRPVAVVSLKHTRGDVWRFVTMIIDTGADYTPLPKFLAEPLGVHLRLDCLTIKTQGVGGMGKVYLLKVKMPAKVGNFTRAIPIGFLDNDYIPPLLGRQEFFETFRVVFDKFFVRFEEPR